MRIVSYNVNGIRAAILKGVVEWIEEDKADIICLQEIKAHPDQFNVSDFEKLGYHTYWMPAIKKGYSGVAILSKKVPQYVAYGCGIDIYDFEGRVIRADYPGFSVMSVYMPSGSSGDLRQTFKMKWLEDFDIYIQSLKNDFPNLVISGDYNICHQPIDIHDPVRNKNSSGFLPEEREWVSGFLSNGFIDTFRYFDKSPHRYSWWSYRARAREKNLGWRIDYHMVTQSMETSLLGASILDDVKHSDHCPIVLELKDI
ncbi:exodeoxyribonuclease III [Catalinimonas niigatensis]|uniref:exodeoxyribonuclease III n=1 Tax=Catalinimonas niigatensis TaxID=1397264 RepID=UPI0026671848|nr:exodeoxyribonuclease III [Catalinimonas niigatensis]WPP48121.1 exodeoxyribonuclease III [Catalinimonas niigatensis]